MYNNNYNYNSFVKSINDLQKKNNNQFQKKYQDLYTNNESNKKSFWTQDRNYIIPDLNLYGSSSLSSSFQNNLLPNKNYNTTIDENYYRKQIYENNINNPNMNINAQKYLRDLNPIISSKVGLRNLGNSCYMNTCLQILMHSKDFIKRLLLKKPFINDRKTPITQQFLNICETVIKTNSNAIAPSDFQYIFCKKHSQFRLNYQYDIQEFCRVLLEDINRELNEGNNQAQYKELNTEGKSKMQCAIEFDELYRKRESSIIIDSFYAQIVNIFKCKKKNKNETYSFERILDLPLLLPNDSESFSLEELLNNYFLDEELKYNQKCKDCHRRKHIKEIKISSPPNILILSLQRINQRTQEKNKCKIKFGEQLNLQSYIDEECGHKNECIYDLYAIGCHAGDMNFGHYFAYIKLNDQDWYEFNDSKVNYIGDNYYNKSTCGYVYVLFYKKNTNINY